jgi:hypothetical protein
MPLLPFCVCMYEYSIEKAVTRAIICNSPFGVSEKGAKRRPLSSAIGGWTGLDRPVFALAHRPHTKDTGAVSVNVSQVPLIPTARGANYGINNMHIPLTIYPQRGRHLRFSSGTLTFYL